MSADREEYEKNLKRIQEEHLKKVKTAWDTKIPWQPCLHDACPECHGTGRKLDGGFCIHGLSCPCPKCSAYC